MLLRCATQGNGVGGVESPLSVFFSVFVISIFQDFAVVGQRPMHHGPILLVSFNALIVLRLREFINAGGRRSPSSGIIREV